MCLDYCLSKLNTKYVLCDKIVYSGLHLTENNVWLNCHYKTVDNDVTKVSVRLPLESMFTS